MLMWKRKEGRCCWIPPLLGSMFLMWFGGLRFPRKSSSLSGKSFLVGLTQFIGLLGEWSRLLDLFVVCFVKKQRKILIILFGIAIMCGMCGVFFSCRSSELVMLVIGAFVWQSKRKGFFVACWCVCCHLECLGGEERSGVSW